MNILYHINKSQIKDIKSHLYNCDENFVLQLGKRINIDDYANKIFFNADKIEAWNNSSLVGLIAFYKNNDENILYITNVSVVNNFAGMGIANQLMINLITFFKNSVYLYILLEVDINNDKAINLYKKFNFLETEVVKNNKILKLSKYE